VRIKYMGSKSIINEWGQNPRKPRKIIPAKVNAVNVVQVVRVLTSYSVTLQQTIDYFFLIL